ncbi:MAG: crossover junction endodeoxyribonuclease RuvC [bacterium]|nr:crossover junction endodeoxyribonuclease RuvC [bacterium]
MKIIGIDPGTAACGFGVIEKNGQKISFLDTGVIATSKEKAPAERLATIYKSLIGLIKKFDPEVLAVEKLFFNTNSKTAIAVGEARGVILLAGAQRGLEIFEYTPLQVKIALTGYGRAEKTQIQKMVKCLLGLSEIPKPDDAADALAIAICHAASMRNF